MKDSFLWHTDKLTGVYRETFDQIDLYAQVHAIDTNAYEEMLADLLDVFLSAQENGEPVEKIIGKDVKTFCESYFSAYRFGDYLKSLPRRYIALPWFVFILELIVLINLWIASDDTFSILTVKTEIGNYLTGFLAGTILSWVIAVIGRLFVFHMKSRFIKWFNGAVIVFIIPMAIVFSLLLPDFVIVIPSYLVLLVSGGCLLLYYGVRAIRNIRRYGRIRAPKEADRISVRKEFQKELDRQLPGELKKRFDKENQRLKKRAKAEQTPREFMDKLRKEMNRSRKIYQVAGVLIFLFALGAGVMEMFSESFVSGLVLFLIIMAAEIPFWSIVKVNTSANSPIERVLAKCDERGITVIQYADELDSERKADDTE